jgi:hypothetical protein
MNGKVEKREGGRHRRRGEGNNDDGDFRKKRKIGGRERGKF